MITNIITAEARSPRQFANAYKLTVKAADPRRTADYGVVFEGASTVRCSRSNNRSFPHRIDVWDNDQRKLEDGTYRGPNNEITTDRYTYLVSAQPIVLSAYAVGDETPHLADVDLVDGDEVDIVYPDGTVTCHIVTVPRWGAGPYLVPMAD